jgi:hypothetical protein
MPKPVQVHDAWGIKDAIMLPGATTTVEVDLSRISTRMRNELTRRVDLYTSTLHMEGGWYAKSRKLFIALREYCGLPNVFINSNYMRLTHLNRELWEEGFAFATADLVTTRFDGDKSDYRLARAQRCLNEAREMGEETEFKELVYEFGSPDTFKGLTEYREKVTAHVRSQLTKQFEQMHDLVQYGGVITLQFTK